MNNPGSIPDGERKDFTASRLAVMPTQPPIQWVPGGSFPGVRAVRASR
jgi:hypothetical protein